MLTIAIAAVSVVFLLTLLVCVRLMRKLRTIITSLHVLKELMAPKSGTNPEQRLVFGRRYLKSLIDWAVVPVKAK